MTEVTTHTAAAVWIIAAIIEAAIYLLMPRLTRSDIFFAITVDPGFRATPEARAIAGGYRVRVLAATAVAIAVAASGGASIAVGTGALLIVVAGSAAALANARNRVKPFAAAPSPVRTAQVSSPRAKMPAMLIFAVPVVAVAVAAAWANLNLQSLPSPFPIHWEMGGMPNGWMTRTRFNVNAFFIPMILVCALCGAIAALIWFGVRRIRSEGPAATVERIFSSVAVLMVLAAEYGAAGAAMLPLGLPVTPILTGGLIVGIAGGVGLLILGQGGIRVAPDRPAEPIGDRTADENWKWGLIYANRDDPALFVEKRFGIGYTLNFGHRASWLVLGLLMAVLAAGALLSARRLFSTPATSTVGAQLAEQVLYSLKDDDFAAAERNFSPVMKNELPPVKLARSWAQTTERLGGLRAWQPSSSEMDSGLEVRDLNSTFTRGRMRIRVVVDPEGGQVDGLWFLDPQPD
jgi:uncharacterized membrane protein